MNFPKEPSEKEVSACRTYDFLVFKALIEYVYNFRMDNGPKKIVLEDRDPDDEQRMSKETRLKRKEVVVAY